VFAQQFERFPTAWGQQRYAWRLCQQAASIDGAFAQCAAAVLPGSESSAALTFEMTQEPLVACEFWAVVNEDWDLLATRRRLLRGDAQNAAIADHHETQCFLLMSESKGLALERISPMQGQLLMSLQVQPLALALAQIEANWPRETLDAMPFEVQKWLAQSVRRGFWRVATATQRGKSVRR
jgi:hypothetical protein